jgi:NAD(P)-dependent dehydrogenase (short-subunit alcohol dehydrogenase family)
VVVVTGASTGIGEASARRLAIAGFTVFAGVRRQEDADRLTTPSLPRLKPIILDVTDPAALAAAVAAVTEAAGAGGLRGLVNNAGVSGGGPIELADLDEVRRIFEVNVVGVIAVTQAFLPLLRLGHGRIAVTGSISGRMAVPFVAPYSASKAAVASICDALRTELRPWGIQVALIEPGSIATPLWEKGLTDFDARAAAYPEEGKRLYGPVMPILRKKSEETAAAGISPDKVAQVVEHALTAAHPRTRYLVGSDARMQATVGKLPDRARDALLSRFMGINGVK